MSRFGMGFGKDQAKHLLNTRPAVAVHSSRCQQVLNKWFKPEDGDRPDFLGKSGEVRVQGSGEGGWELEWHPRSRVGTCTMPARRVLRTLKDEEDRELIREKLTKELRMLETKSKLIDGSIDRDVLHTGRSSATDVMSRRLRTGHSSRASSRAGEDADMPLGTARSRMSTSSRRSGKSAISGTSTSTALTKNRDEMLKRIQGLEKAVLQEKTMREEMQTLLTLEEWAKDGGQSAKGTARARR
ncbi:hypothetical protein T484DRAFT_1893691 [Baffinella frigidus]|nr:hypothetical protein T484DRAFT_1893691 [Cryptophyta sp. CCMP2293]